MRILRACLEKLRNPSNTNVALRRAVSPASGRLDKPPQATSLPYKPELGFMESLCCRSTQGASSQTDLPAPQTAPKSDCRTRGTPTKRAPHAGSCYRATYRIGPALEQTIPPGSADTDWKNSGTR